MDSLNVHTAKALFDTKITPIAFYGIQLALNCSALKQLEDLDQLKASYLKRRLAVHRSSDT